jgi:hypothetical protein
MTGSSFPELKHPIWMSKFVAAVTERVREKWPEQIKEAEHAIFNRIDELEDSPASIDDLNEWWAMSCALAILRSFRTNSSQACERATQDDRKTA